MLKRTVLGLVRPSHPLISKASPLWFCFSSMRCSRRLVASTGKLLANLLLLLGLVVAAPGVATTGELPRDANTLLLLHFNNNMIGADGEVPTQSVGVTFESGVFGNGAYLSTTNQVYYSVANNVHATEGTLEFWVKPRWNGDDGQTHTILRYGATGGILVEKDGGNFWKILLNRWVGGSEVGAGLYVTDWNANEWHHAAFTWDNTSVKVYVDGQLKSETTPTITLPSIPDATFQIGAGWTYDHFDAVLDELRISDRERTASEILTSYVAGLTISSLWIEPDTVRAFEGWSVPAALMAETNMGTMTLPLGAAVWVSSDSLVASYEGGERLSAHSAGTATLTATLNGVEADVTFVVNTPVLPPTSDPVPSFLATPADRCRFEVPVLVIRYLPTADGTNLDVSVDPDYWWLNPISLTDLKSNIDAFMNRSKFALEEGSRFRAYKKGISFPSIGYRVIGILTVYEPTPPGLVIGMSKDPDGDPTEYPIYEPDYQSIFERFDVADYVTNHGVEEIWFWSGGLDAGYPSYDPLFHDPRDFRSQWESNMSSAVTGDVSNSDRNNNDLPIYDHTYTVYGYNFRRTQAEAVHNHGHQIEAQLTYVNVLQDGNSYLFWRDFVGQDTYGNFVTGRCGWTHMPPNTTTGYDYCNSADVWSDIEDWTPDGSGEQTLVSCDRWANLVFDWPNGEVTFPQKTETQFYIYWMQSLPGLWNGISYGANVMTNWWSFIANWDENIAAANGLYALPTGIVDANDEAPSGKTMLRGVYPNPFNPTTAIEYEIKHSGHVSLAIYNVAGQLVRTLVDEVKPSGVVHKRMWDGYNDAGERVSSGVYFVRLATAGGPMQTKKTVFLK